MPTVPDRSRAKKHEPRSYLLRVEQLEERVLLSGSGLLQDYQTLYPPVSAPLSAQVQQSTSADQQHPPVVSVSADSAKNNRADPSQSSAESGSEYANGLDTDGSAGQPAPSAGQENTLASNAGSSAAGSTPQSIAYSPPVSGTRSGNPAYPANNSAVPAYPDSGDSSNNGGDAYEYQAGSTPANDPHAVKPQTTPKVDGSVLLVTEQAGRMSAAHSEGSTAPATAGFQVAASARLQAPASAGATETLIATGHGQGGAPAVEVHSPAQPAPEPIDVQESQEISEDQLISEPPPAGQEGQPLAPQGITALAGMAPLDMQALEQGVQKFLASIDAVGKVWMNPLGHGLGSWLAGGLVAAAAFEVALWRAARKSVRGLFVVSDSKAPTWTWFPGRSKPGWRENS